MNVGVLTEKLYYLSAIKKNSFGAVTFSIDYFDKLLKKQVKHECKQRHLVGKRQNMRLSCFLGS